MISSRDELIANLRAFVRNVKDVVENEAGACGTAEGQMEQIALLVKNWAADLLGGAEDDEEENESVRVKCSMCGGSGRVLKPGNPAPCDDPYMTCPACNGDGYLEGR